MTETSSLIGLSHTQNNFSKICYAIYSMFLLWPQIGTMQADQITNELVMTFILMYLDIGVLAVADDVRAI